MLKMERKALKVRGASSGQAIVLIALAMVALIGVLGMTIDGGGLFFLHRDTQNAVDAALIAAAYARCTANPLESPRPTAYENRIVTAGLQAAKNDGFGSGLLADNGATINGATVLIEPDYTDPTTNRSGYVRAEITAVKPSYFIQLLWPGALEVTSSGVARCQRSYLGLLPQAAIFATRTTSECNLGNGEAIANTGTSRIHVSGDIFSNSQNPDCAIDGRGHSTFTVTGACQTAGTGGFDHDDVACGSYPSALSETWPQNPFNDTIDRPACIAGEHPTGNGYAPGTYSSWTLNNNDDVFLQPGLYCFTGEGIKMTGGYLHGDGVFFYFYPAGNGGPSNGGIAMNGGSANLTAPSDNNCIPGTSAGATCDYTGLHIWKDTTLDTITDSTVQSGGSKNEIHFNGGAGSSWTGTVYAPATECTVEGNQTATFRGMFVCYSVRGAGGGNQPLNLQIIYEAPDFLTRNPEVGIAE